MEGGGGGGRGSWGWEGSRGGGWEAEGGSHLPLEHTDSGAVSSVRDRYRHSAQDRQRWLLAVVWHHPHPY